MAQCGGASGALKEYGTEGVDETKGKDEKGGRKWDIKQNRKHFGAEILEINT